MDILTYNNLILSVRAESSRMYCSKCGARIGEADRFCRECGRGVGDETASEADERELYSFGPLGVRIFHSRPSVFAWSILNMTRIVLTDKRIYGFPKGALIPTKLLFKSSARFQVPYESIVATEHVGLGFQEGVWIQYREGGKLKEVSILCSPVNSYHIPKTLEILQNRASAR